MRTLSKGSRETQTDPAPFSPNGTSYRHGPFFFKAADFSPNELYIHLDGSPQGLTEDDARSRRERLGPNEIGQESLQWPRQLLKALLNPFILLLTALAIISDLTDDQRGATVMGAMVTISVCLTFFQEFRSTRAAQKLQSMVSTSATAVRRHSTGVRKQDFPREEPLVSRRVEIPIRELVPGDLIHLSAGDMVPADVRILSSKDLFVGQSSLTGESLPVEKFPSRSSLAPSNLADLSNICLMGTSIVSGTAQAIVLKTGRNTFLGSIAKTLSRQRRLTSFDRGSYCKCQCMNS